MEMERNRGVAPWVWVLIVLAAVVLIFVVWWVVAAGNRDQDVVVVPGPSQPTDQQPEQPAQPNQPTQPTQPVVVQPERPVNIYVQDRDPSPRVIIVPEGDQRPSDVQNATNVDLPDAFRYQGKTYTASENALKTDTMRDTGLQVQGKTVYARQDASAPYDSLYLETSSGSGIYLEYKVSSSQGNNQ